MPPPLFCSVVSAKWSRILLLKTNFFCWHFCKRKKWEKTRSQFPSLRWGGWHWSAADAWLWSVCVWKWDVSGRGPLETCFSQPCMGYRWWTWWSWNACLLQEAKGDPFINWLTGLLREDVFTECWVEKQGCCLLKYFVVVSVKYYDMFGGVLLGFISERDRFQYFQMPVGGYLDNLGLFFFSEGF